MMRLNRERNIILTARIISLVFTPFYLPLVGLMALFVFSYLGLMPWAYKLQLLTLVYVFTILLPIRSAVSCLMSSPSSAISSASI